MTTRTLTALFSSQPDADRAGQTLVGESHVDKAMIRTSPGAGVTDAGFDQGRPYEEKGFFGSLRDTFVPDEDRYAYVEGMRRGNVLLTAQVDEAHVNRAADILEQAGALDLDEQEASWRESGWTGYDAAAYSSMRPTATTGVAGAAAGQGGPDDTLKVVEERLVVGKRVVEGNRVRVRSYVVERPVEEQVTLHDERVQLERHAVDRVATAGDIATFKDRTIEAAATGEEAVVGKEIRVVEEIAVKKEASDRVETVRDTVRHIEVDVEDGTTAAAT